MQSYWKIELWAKFVNHFDVLTIYGVEKSQCDGSMAKHEIKTTRSSKEHHGSPCNRCQSFGLLCCHAEPEVLLGQVPTLGCQPGGMRMHIWFKWINNRLPAGSKQSLEI